MINQYRIILKGGSEIEMEFDFDFSLAMVKPGYFNDAIYSSFGRVYDRCKRCVLYGEIAGWELIKVIKKHGD